MTRPLAAAVALALLAAAPRAQAQRKVFLNPSDQTWNSVACGGNESQYAIDTANRAASKIQAAGFRTKIVAGLSRAVDAANAWPADIYVSVHTNAGGGHGTETFYYGSNGAGRSLASKVQNGLQTRFDAGDRGVRSNTSFYVLRHTHMTAALTESLFHDCRTNHAFPNGRMTEACFLKSSGGREIIASGIAAGACSYYGRTCGGGACTPATETCDGRDNDCDGSVDDGLSRPACSKTAGVCAGAKKRCGGTSGWLACTASDYGSAYESSETKCDGKDNDCDGGVDESLTAPACEKNRGVCAGARKRCGGASGWLACAAADYGAGYEAAEKSCDGKDNDCDGAVDESLEAPACAKSLGVCAGRKQRCGGASGWLACAPPDYGAGYELEETLCDGKDNDCDGHTDEGLVAPSCGKALGVCAAASKRCGGAAGWLACGAADFGAAYEGVEAACDGLDNDCDGETDEGLAAPACEKTAGVCAGRQKRCGGASGWLACDPVDYGAPYEPVEKSCDGLDNDCDGATDGAVCAPDPDELTGESFSCGCQGAPPAGLLPFALAALLMRRRRRR